MADSQNPNFPPAQHQVRTESENRKELADCGFPHWSKVCLHHMGTRLSKSTGSILQETALLPICQLCAFQHASQPTGLVSSAFDKCVCATNIVSSACWICKLEGMEQVKKDAIALRERKDQAEENRQILCKCGIDIAEDYEVQEEFELARQCVCCQGIVNRRFENVFGVELKFEWLAEKVSWGYPPPAASAMDPSSSNMQTTTGGTDFGGTGGSVQPGATPTAYTPQAPMEPNVGAPPFQQPAPIQDGRADPGSRKRKATSISAEDEVIVTDRYEGRTQMKPKQRVNPFGTASGMPGPSNMSLQAQLRNIQQGQYYPPPAPQPAQPYFQNVQQGYQGAVPPPQPAQPALPNIHQGQQHAPPAPQHGQPPIPSLQQGAPHTGPKPHPAVGQRANGRFSEYDMSVVPEYTRELMKPPPPQPNPTASIDIFGGPMNYPPILPSYLSHPGHAYSVDKRKDILRIEQAAIDVSKPIPGEKSQRRILYDTEIGNREKGLRGGMTAKQYDDLVAGAGTGPGVRRRASEFVRKVWGGKVAYIEVGMVMRLALRYTKSWKDVMEKEGKENQGGQEGGEGQKGGG